MNLEHKRIVLTGFFQAAGSAPVPRLSQSPEAAARATLRGIETDHGTIDTFRILRPMLWSDHLVPCARRWYQALDGRVARRQLATREKNEKGTQHHGKDRT
jgi:hypothetical protein